MTTKSKDLAPPKEGINFESLPWNLNLPEEHTYLHLKTTSIWTEKHVAQLNESLVKYSTTPVQLSPACTSLNYGTTIWEGLKCYRTSSGKAVVFRPDRNFARFARGAEAMGLPVVPKELFLKGIQTVLKANDHLIPPAGEGMKLYVRPILFGSGQQLGLYPSKEFSLVFYVSPTGNYFKGASGGLHLHLETKRSRAARGGLGSVKCSGNYAIALRPLLDCKKHGFADNLYLELETYEEGSLDEAVLQELSAGNFFLVLKTGEIVTPSLDRGTILPGVTRESVVAIGKKFAEDLKEAMARGTGDDSISVAVSERDVTVGDIRNATEAFCTGTAAGLVPIARLATAPDEEPFDVTLPHGSQSAGPVTAKLSEMLFAAQTGEIEVEEGWLRDLCSTDFAS